MHLLRSLRPHRRHAASSCRRPARVRSIPHRPPRLPHQLRLRRKAQRDPEASSADVPSSIDAQAAPASVPARVELPAEHQDPPAHAVPCTPRAALPLAAPRARALASASAPAWARAPASASGPAPPEPPALLCRLPVKRRVRSVPLVVAMRAAAVSSIPSPKKAR